MFSSQRCTTKCHANPEFQPKLSISQIPLLYIHHIQEDRSGWKNGGVLSGLMHPPKVGPTSPSSLFTLKSLNLSSWPQVLIMKGENSTRTKCGDYDSVMHVDEKIPEDTRAATSRKSHSRASTRRTNPPVNLNSEKRE